MISILLPVYNADCVPLAEKMKRMADKSGVPYEIVVADDASTLEVVRERNAYVATWPECRYLQLERNLGPAGVRNYLADNAQYSYLLFLDSDTMPVDDDFFERYVAAAHPGTLVCGGFVYNRDAEHPGAELRFKYGIEVEERNAEQRMRHPYRNFISMNFMIYRESFMRVRFDESFRFGYEDNMFGMMLQRAGVEIVHIDNPVFHNAFESTERYLKKMRVTMENLVGREEELRPYVRLLQWYGRVADAGMTGVVATVFKRMEPAIVKNLTGKNPSLRLFAFYKLGYLCVLNQ